jgi:Protein of unknown function (DUF2628)
VAPTAPGPPSRDVRPYEVRLSRLPDPAVRDRVARLLVDRFPPRELGATRTALAGSGLLLHVPLGDAEVPALARDLYAAGVPPAGLVLLPVDLGRTAEAGDSREEAAFKLFEARNGGFVPTWSWAAFVFGPLWYFKKGLYGKGAILLILVIVPVLPFVATVLLQLGAFGYCGVVGHWDHYLLRMRRTQWW